MPLATAKRRAMLLGALSQFIARAYVSKALWQCNAASHTHTLTEVPLGLCLAATAN